MHGLQGRVAEENDEGFSAFCRSLPTSLSHLPAARRRCIGGALSESMAPLREILAASKEKLARSAPSVGGDSTNIQEGVAHCMFSFL